MLQSPAAREHRPRTLTGPGRETNDGALLVGKARILKMRAGARRVFRSFFPPAASVESGEALQPIHSSGILGAPALLGPTVMGLCGIVAIVVTACLPGSPFSLQQPGAWFFGVPADQAPVHVTAGLRVVELAGGLGGLILLSRAWLSLWWASRNMTEVTPTTFGRVMAIWIAPLVAAPPLLSQDVYSYAAQGEMMSWHISPYAYGPMVLGVTPFQTLSHGVWSNTASPYGPLFLGIAGGLVRMAHHHVVPSLLLFRLVSVAGVIVAAACVPALARHCGRPAAPAFVLGPMNPLVLLFVVGGAHNEGLLLGLTALGVLMALRNHVIAGLALCTLAAAVKAPTLLPVGYIAWWWIRQSPSAWVGVRRACATALTVGGTFGILNHLTGLGWGWLRDVGDPAQVFSWTTPVDLVGVGAHALAVGVGLDVSLGPFIATMHTLGLVLAALFVLVIWWRSRQGLNIAAIGVSLAIVALLGPTVQGWYLTWGVILLAVAAKPPWQLRLARASIALTFIDVFTVNTVASDFRSTLYVGALLVLAVCLLASCAGRPTERADGVRLFPPRDIVLDVA
jgi:hypothetical protein